MYKQAPNRRPWVLFRVPTRLWLYYQYRNKSSKLAKWVIKKIAEPPTIYEERLTQTTARNIQNQVQQHGYFDAKCTYETKTIGKHKAKVHYILSSVLIHTIDTVRYESGDSLVLQILREQASTNLSSSAGPAHGRACVLESEKIRITNELRNRGYAYFAPNFVALVYDSTGTRTNVTIEILTPGDLIPHKTYTIGDIEVFSSVCPDLMAIRKDTVINSINFRSGTTEFRVNPRGSTNLSP